MTQGKGVKGLKEKKKVPGWSIEEMRRKPNIAVVEHTEEIREWKGLNQSEMDLCWKNLAERMEEEVLDKYKVEESKRKAFRGRGDPWNGGGCAKTKSKQKRLLGNNFSLFRECNLQRLQKASRRSQRKKKRCSSSSKE